MASLAALILAASALAHGPTSGQGKGQPNLSSGPSGLVLSWLESAKGRPTRLMMSRWDGKAWGAPVRVTEGADLLVNWADFPSTAQLADGRLAAQWLRVPKGAAKSYYGNVEIALSADGGKTWGRPMVPHRDGTISEHGFASLVPLAGGGLAAVWLDGRQTVAAKKGPQALYAAVLGKEGFGPEQVVDAAVCDCCQTSAAATPKGFFVAYRDRTDKEVRDVAVARFEDGAWKPGKIVHADGWVMPGCPVNGPAVASQGSEAVLAWFTAAQDKPRLQLAFSRDGAASFGPAIRFDEGEPMGRVDVELLEDGSAAAVWIEKDAVRARRVRPDGSLGPVVAVADRAGRGFPRLARSADGLWAAWPAPSGIAKLRLALP